MGRKGRPPIQKKDESFKDEIPVSFLPKKDLFSFSEVERFFGIDPTTRRRWVDHGHLIIAEKGGSMFVTRESMLNCRLVKPVSDSV